MEYTKLGRTGLDVSRICLGCMSYGEGDRGNHAWSLGEEESRPFIKRALEAGINFFGGPQLQQIFRKGVGWVKGTFSTRLGGLSHAIKAPRGVCVAHPRLARVKLSRNLGPTGPRQQEISS
jgi:hypothetical protein